MLKKINDYKKIVNIYEKYHFWFKAINYNKQLKIKVVALRNNWELRLFINYMRLNAPVYKDWFLEYLAKNILI